MDEAPRERSGISLRRSCAAVTNGAWADPQGPYSELYALFDLLVRVAGEMRNGALEQAVTSLRQRFGEERDEMSEIVARYRAADVLKFSHFDDSDRRFVQRAETRIRAPIREVLRRIERQ